MRNLEKEMGTELFVRAKMGMTLTPNGEKFLATAQNILGQIHQLKMDFSLSQLANTSDTQLTILISPIFDSIILSDAINTFAKTCPHVELQIAEKTAEDILAQLAQDDPQPMIGFVNLKNVEDMDSAFRFYPLAKVRYCILAPKGQPLDFQSGFTYQKLLAHPIALFESQAKTSPCYTMLAQQGTVNLALSTNSYNTFRKALYHGIAIGIVPEFALLDIESSSGRLQHIKLPDEGFFSTLGILVNQRHLASPSIKLILEIAKHTVQSSHLPTE